MNKQERETQIKDYPKPPTSLNLFPYSSALESVKTQKLVNGALQFENDFNKTRNSLKKLLEQRDKRLGGLSLTNTELEEDVDNLMSSISCGVAYLKIRDELPELPEQDLMDFFKLCLVINTRLGKEPESDITAETVASHVLHMMKSRQSVHKYRVTGKTILDEMLDNPPKWFKGNNTAWRDFVGRHSNFSPYINEKLFTDITGGRASLKQLLGDKDKLLGHTIEGEFPDWFLENKIPTKEQVEQEITEDRDEEAKAREALSKIKKQKSYLEDTVSQKFEKAHTHLVNHAEKTVFSGIQNFVDLITYIKILHNISDSPWELAEKAIQDWVTSSFLLTSKEPVALYIENKLREGKIMEDAQEPIDENFLELFTMAVEHIEEQRKEQPSKTKFETLRETNKKAFNILNFDIRPFLEVLSKEELSFLKELLDDSKDKPIEYFIWDISSFVSSRFKDVEEDQLAQSQRGAIYYLTKYIASFARKNSLWAFEQLQKSLSLQEDKIGTFTPEQPIEQKGPEPIDSQEIDSTTNELMKENLTEWRIFYTKNKSATDKDLIEIGGQSLEEREKLLRDVLIKESLPSSIKPGSIMRTLEWLVSVPENVEQVRIRKNIDGQIFKKLKRGNVRIFYIMDPLQKSIIFFTHQKKSWNYGF